MSNAISMLLRKCASRLQLGDRLRRILRRLGAIALTAMPVKGAVPALVVVIVGTSLCHCEAVKQEAPWLMKAQLGAHALLAHLTPRTARVKWVTPIEIDDDAYWRPPLAGRIPTNRRYLADLAKAAAQQGAALIALDFRLTLPGADTADDPTYREENEYFFETIRQIVSRNIPVVLATFLADRREDGERIVLKNIYNTRDLGVRAGHINMPIDPRHIPLEMSAYDAASQRDYSVPSFAEAIVDAYEAASNISSTRDLPVLAEARERNEFVFGGFLGLDAFRQGKITSTSLLAGDSNARCCRNKIVIIGATWHSSAANIGPLIEDFPSPVGELPGLYMHANYVEALLDDRFSSEVPLWIGILVDIIFGIALYHTYHRTKARTLGILVVFFLLLLVPYVLLVDIGIYLDATIPLLLLLVHLGWEHYSNLREKAQTPHPSELPVSDGT